MFVHIGQTIHEFPVKDIDSIIFYRTAPKPTQDYSNLRLNEVNGTGGDRGRFYELINIGNTPINLEGVRIFYNANGDLNGVFPPNGNQGLTWTGCRDQIIQPSGLFTIIGRGTTPCTQFTTGLTAQRILIITLEDPSGNILDQCIRAQDVGVYAIEDKSFSRIPDGTGPFYFTDPTPNASNGTSTAGLRLLPQTPQGGGNPTNFYDHPVFDIDALPTITFEVSVEEWNTLLANFDINPRNGERVRADFIFSKDGVETKLPNVGFRYRGNTSRRRPEISPGGVHDPNNPIWQSMHFNINFRDIERDQRLFGLRRLTLKWHKDDAMYCREIYSFDLFRRFGVWTAPRASFAKVYVKVGNTPPAYFGIYAMIEHVDIVYVQDRHQASYFETSTGNLWQGHQSSGPNGGPADLTLSNALNKMGVEVAHLDESQSQRFTYDLGTSTDNLEAAKTEFHNWLVNLNTLTGDAFKTWISSNFDVDLFLRAYAVNVALGQWDGYWGNANNFYLYFDRNTGKVYYIPWDYDNTLGTSMFFDAGTENVLRWGGAIRPLVDKIFAIPEFRAQYVAYLKELVDPENDLFHVDRSIPRIQNWHNMIQPYISADVITNSETSNTLIDRPASWGNRGHYKILERGNNNFFEVKTATILQTNPTDTTEPIIYNSMGLVGDFSGWDNDVWFTQSATNPSIWTINNVQLPVGGVKFRVDGNWGINWGSNGFPSGTGMRDGPNIPVSEAGNYSVQFNSHTLEYIFTKLN
jgi:hypothetical protein